MFKQLSHAQLDDHLCTAISQVEAINPRMAVFFHVLYSTGLRVSEVHEFYRWQKFSSNQAIVSLAKGEVARIIDLSTLPIDVNNWLDENCDLPWFYTIRQYRSVLQRCLPYQIYVSGDKVLQFHLFRFNYVWRLMRNGLSEMQIIQHVGWHTIESFHHYRDSIIYCK